MIFDRLASLGAAATAHVLCLGVTGCATHPLSHNIDPLVGRWRYADSSSTAEYLFAADGKFTGSVAREGKTIWSYAGKWSHAGSVLNYTYTKSSADFAPPGTQDQDMLLEVRRAYYVIQARDGSRRKYLRVQ